MTRDVAVAKFRRACALLREVEARTGLQVYVSGSGCVHLMDGDSHDGVAARPRQDRIVATESVPAASGGDW